MRVRLKRDQIETTRRAALAEPWFRVRIHAGNANARTRSSLAAAALALSIGLGFALRADQAGPASSAAAQLFHAGEVHGQVRDGGLWGSGYEHVDRLSDGGLRVVRVRDYDRLTDPKSKRIVTLPEAWQVRATLVLSPQLRLRRSDTTFAFHRSVDRALGYDASHDELAWLFESNRVVVNADRAGSALTLLAMSDGRVIRRDHYAYPRDAVPIELTSLAVSVQLVRRVSRFEFDVLLPGGDTHGVKAVVHRAADPTPFTRGYRLPAPALALLKQTREGLAIVDLYLASPFKRIVFPHHFYFVYAYAAPDTLLSAWGGDPDEPMLAFQTP